MQVCRQDINGAHDVSMTYATASRAPVDASAGLFSLPTHGACLTRVAFILQHYFDPDMLGLVRDILAQPPVRPARDLLVRSVAQVDTICDVPHVADDDLARSSGHSLIDNGARDLVKDVPLTAFLRL